MKKLIKVTFDRLNEFVPDSRALKSLKNEKIFSLNSVKPVKVDPFIRIEVAARKCKRLGVFRR